MKRLKLQISVLLILTLLGAKAFAVNYSIDGYVVVENLYLPVEDQIVEFRNNNGVLIASALTNESGYYFQDVDLPVSAQKIVLSVSRSCNGEVLYYDQELMLDKYHLGYTFLVCEDKVCEARYNYQQLSRNSLIFEFTNISSGDIENYFWNFGDGTSSTEENPVHEYTQPNVYNVTLTINGQNCTDAVARQVTVNYLDCMAKFSYNQVNQGQALTIEFKNESEGVNLQYLWNFGSFGSSYEENPTVGFSAPGYYLVTLNVARQGCFNGLTKIVEVAPLTKCFALFESEQLFSPELQVQFTDLAVGGDILYWVWLFGDGTTSTERNPLHVYDEPGLYETSLRVISASSQGFYSRTFEVVESSGCLADFEFIQPNPDNPQINFNSLTANGNLQFFWDFGDGDVSTEKSPAHQYDAFGSYQVSLSVLGYGCTDTSFFTIFIEEPVYCEAKFSYQQAFPQSRQISFIDQSYGDDINYLWDFGDGEVSNSINPVHIYQSYGQYQIKLLINNSQNCTDSAFADIEILPPLIISGHVFAGNIPLGLGSAFLYRISESDEIDYLGNYDLDEGYFEFVELEPGTYFIQAIPNLVFPFPVIPFYYPVYSGAITRWQNAEIIHTDALPQEINIYLESYNDFFDGKSSLSGKISQASGDDGLPLIVYLSNDFGEIFQFRWVDEQKQFSFENIPYGSYNVLPEKAGKTSQSFDLTLDETVPVMNNILFLETENAIIPDLSFIGEQSKSEVPVIYPNPPSDFFKIQFPPQLQHIDCRIKIYNSVSKLLLIEKTISADDKIYLTDLNDGFYIVEISTGQNTFYSKLIIRN